MSLEAASFIVSLLVLAVLVASLLVQRRTASIEKARREDEVRAARRADVAARVVHGPGTPLPNTFIVLRGQGPADARDVNVREEGEPPPMHRLITTGDDFPIPRLPDGHEFAIRYVGGFDDSPVVNLSITWTDDEGTHEKHVRLNTV